MYECVCAHVSVSACVSAYVGVQLYVSVYAFECDFACVWADTCVGIRGLSGIGSHFTRSSGD